MYESFYKLKERPFQLSPDPRFFYGSPGHKRAMSYLRYGLTQGEGFIVITGDIGTGKTTLVRTLFQDLSQENIVAAQLVTTQLEADDTLRMVAASFGLAHEGQDKATVLKNLETFMVARAREGKRVLLVVDEAQNLPPRSLEELRMLSNFNLDGKVLFQSFLLGQAEFRQTLQARGMEQLRQRVIAAYHLDPLDAEQCRGYMEHRLHTVGWNNDPSFTDGAYALIHEFTRGIPRRINSLCDRLLLYGALEGLRELGEQAVQTVITELTQETGPVAPVSPVATLAPAAAPASSPAAAPMTPPRRIGTAAPARKPEAVRESKPVAAVSQDPVEMTQRIAELEQRLADLEDAFRKERARLRRAILFSEWNE